MRARRISEVPRGVRVSRRRLPAEMHPRLTSASVAPHVIGARLEDDEAAVAQDRDLYVGGVGALPVRQEVLLDAIEHLGERAHRCFWEQRAAAVLRAA